MFSLSVVTVAIARVLDLLRDRKDRSTRAFYDHETALMHDIKAAGIRNPLKVYAEGQNYRLVCGQTRLCAARRAGLTEVPVIVLEGEMTPTRLLIEELTDNNMTMSFDILAQGEIFVELMREAGWSPAELSRNVPAAKPAAVSKALSILESLIAELKDRLRAGQLGPRLAYALCRVPPERQAAVYDRVKGEKVETAEALISDMLGATGGRQKPQDVKYRCDGATATFPEGWSLERRIEWLKARIEEIKRDGRGLSPVKP